MLYKSKISKGFQAVIPSKIRREYGIKAGDVIEWINTKEGVIVKFRRRRTLKDIVGIVSTPSNAVELKKKIQRGI